MNKNIKCTNCKKEVHWLEVFPDGLCLYCYDNKTKNEPLKKPDFIKTIKI